MNYDKLLTLDIVRITESAAIKSAELIGLGDEKAADYAAVEAMRSIMNLLSIKGRIVIGEGERDEAPMLYIGEKVGTGEGIEVDIAVDPLEGTTLTATGQNGAISVLAMAEKGGLLNAPDVYMKKLAVGPEIDSTQIGLDMSIKELIMEVSSQLNKKPEDITVLLLKRSRHEAYVEEVYKVGARVAFISDGDVEGAMSVAMPMGRADIYLGVGGAPEGVLAAAGLTCVGGYIEGQLLFRNEAEKERAKKWGITDLNKIYKIHDLVKSPVIYAATAVTDTSTLRGVQFLRGQKIQTESIVLRSRTHTQRYIRTIHNLHYKNVVK